MKTRRRGSSSKKATPNQTSGGSEPSPTSAAPVPSVIVKPKTEATDKATPQLYAQSNRTQGLHSVAGTVIRSAQKTSAGTRSPHQFLGNTVPPSASSADMITLGAEDPALQAGAGASTSWPAVSSNSAYPPQLINDVRVAPERIFSGEESSGVIAQNSALTNVPNFIIQRSPSSSHTLGHVFEATSALLEEKPLVIAQDDRAMRAADVARTDNESPVHLTELVVVNSNKPCSSPPSDRNHNVTASYGGGLSHSAQLPPISSISFRQREVEDVGRYKNYFETDQAAALIGQKTHAAISDSPVNTSVNLHSDVFASPPLLSYDAAACSGSTYSSYYPLAHAVCRSYSFTRDTSSEHSSPEALQQSYHIPTASPYQTYATPSLVDVSAASDGSAVSAATTQWDNGAVAGAAAHTAPTYTSLGTYNPVDGNSAPTPPRGSAGFSNGDRLTTAGSAVTPYFSEDSDGADLNSMREIQQEILRADIERHIYENYHNRSALPPYPMDDDDDDDDDDDEGAEGSDDVSEGTSSHGGEGEKRKPGTSGSNKKRRRRTQTPIQRKAANMRERKRMCHLNFAFDALKDRLPNVRNRKKLSRIQTLRAAIFYIGLLSECVQTS